MLPPGAIFKLKIHQNVYAAGALPRTPLGELQNPRPPSWFSGATSRQERRGEKGGEERKREGESIPTLQRGNADFFTT